MGKILRTVSIGVGAVALSFAAASAHGRTLQQEPDNTSSNKNQDTTADQQKNNPADRELAQKIRQSISNDKSLSIDAHNVKVIVRNGKVILKGPVQSEDEKKSIVDKASDLAGADNVTNKLTVKS
ncbi:MAG: BON domain-containing protein [Candidatus Acidiferrum sp.]